MLKGVESFKQIGSYADMRFFRLALFTTAWGLSGLVGTAAHAKSVTVIATGFQNNLAENITVEFTIDDEVPLTFSSATTSQAQLSAPKPVMKLTSDQGLDLTLPIFSITVQNDLIDPSDTTTLGIRDSINVFAKNEDSTLSANFKLDDFLAIGVLNDDPNDALDSASIPAAFGGLNFDPFIRREPWSRGTIGINGDISRQAEITSVIATPLPPALLLLGSALLGLMSVTRWKYAKV